MAASGLRLGQVDTELPTAAALADGAGNPTAPMMGAAGLVWNGATWDRARGAGIGDSAAAGITAMGQYLYNPATPGWERRRTPTKWGSFFVSAAGDTTLWTPAAGKKFRLMAFQISLPGNCYLAAANVFNIQLKDNAGTFLTDWDIYLPAAAPNTPGVLFHSGWVDWGNGYLGAAANNALTGWTNVALLGSPVRISWIGTEE